MTSKTSFLETDKKNFLDSIENASLVLKRQRRERTITGGTVITGLTRLDIPENLLVVGDLHGDLKSLNEILDRFAPEWFLSNPNNKLVFLGDYVDRGSGSIEVLQKICELKSKYSEVVILMRGNHEAPDDFPFPSHQLPSEISSRFGHDGLRIYNKVLEFFQLLTLVTVIDDKIFLVHGGPPTNSMGRFYDVLSTAGEDTSKKHILEEILWNDPRSLPEGVSFEKSRRLFGKHFGETVSKDCLAISGTRIIIRGHEPCHAFRTDHNGMVLTIFSCNEAYPKFDPACLCLTGTEIRLMKDVQDLVPHIQKIKRKG